MLGLDADMRTVFFGPDFSTPFLHSRAGVPLPLVVGILGVEDEEALDGRVMAATRVMRLPSSYDLRAGDQLVAQEAIPTLGIAIGDAFRVLEPPQRVNDGAEMEALLGSVTP